MLANTNCLPIVLHRDLVELSRADPDEKVKEKI